LILLSHFSCSRKCFFNPFVWIDAMDVSWLKYCGCSWTFDKASRSLALYKTDKSKHRIVMSCNLNARYHYNVK
jgi:hypothetical protein